MTRDNYIVKNTLQELEGLLVDKCFGTVCYDTFV